jgi:hypothetical protein
VPEQRQHCAESSEIVTYLALRVPDSLIDTEDQACGLNGTAESVDLDETGLPDEALHVVLHTFRLNVDTSPSIALSVTHPELVQDIGRVEAGVVTDLTRNDFESLGDGTDDELLLAVDGTRVITKVL